MLAESLTAIYSNQNPIHGAKSEGIATSPQLAHSLHCSSLVLLAWEVLLALLLLVLVLLTDKAPEFTDSESQSDLCRL